MAVAQVGSTVTGQVDGEASSISSGSKSTTTGNAISVEVKWEHGGGNPITQIDDTAGNIYTIVSQGAHSNGVLRSAIAYCLNVTGHASNVVTATYTGGGASWNRIIVKEWSGVVTASGLDDSDSAEGTSGTYSTPALTTTQLGVVVAGLGTFASLGTITPGGTPTFTHSGTVSDTASFHYISSTGQTITPGASANNHEWIMRAIALKGVVEAPPPAPRILHPTQAISMR